MRVSFGKSCHKETAYYRYTVGRETGWGKSGESFDGPLIFHANENLKYHFTVSLEAIFHAKQRNLINL